MKIKQIILIIIVIAALAGAGVFGYMSVKGKSTGTTKKKTGTILPHGNNLDFGTVDKFNETGRQFEYPATTPADLGQPLNEIISQ
jgi:hypothetical protein